MLQLTLNRQDLKKSYSGKNQTVQNAAPDTDQYVVRRLYDDGDGDDDNAIIVKRKRLGYLHQNPPNKKKGYGVYDWMSLSDPTLKWK